jgi:3'(2'), 5'-bisphosphate nucleotidase
MPPIVSALPSAVSNAIDLSRELAVATRAVRAAALVTRRVQLAGTGTALAKSDASPVTVADFAAQAVVCARVQEESAVRGMVGEESAAELAADDASEVRARVVAEVSALGGVSVDAAAVLEWIDAGRVAAPQLSACHWTLDPVDGTKGFLRREHYAIALALIVDGQVVLGALGCPRLAAPDGTEGLLLTALCGGGAFASALFTGSIAGDGAAATRVRVSDVMTPAAARFCESVESGHSDHDATARIATRLGITQAPLRLDSQAKYATVASGAASIYLRMPTRADYREKIWDHAAGAIIVAEAGGRVSDADGAPLDFSRGRRLEANRGVVATNGHIHDAVLAAIAG